MMKIVAHPQPQESKTLLENCGLHTSDLDIKKFEDFLYLEDVDNPLGVVGLEKFGSVALLRSLAVSKESRGKGYGKALVSAMENFAKDQNIKELYLLTETAEPFFKRLKYCSIPRDLAPESIRNSSEYSGVCPQSAVLMTKQLKG
jgi:amino-acid N-acetyltransferase